jgi:hypothetical protein
MRDRSARNEAGIRMPLKIEEVNSFEELCSWVETHFECIQGTPRAYMEFFIPPIGEAPGFIHREVYSVVSIGAYGLRAEVEEPLVHAMMRSLTEIRLLALKTMGFEHQTAVEDGLKPRMWVRRAPEFQEEFARPAGVDADTGHWVEAMLDRCKISMRFSVPGADLDRWSTADGTPLFYLNSHGK